MDLHKHLPDELVPRRRNEPPVKPAKTAGRPPEQTEPGLPAALTLRGSGPAS
jgi:hypothetical protein